MANMANVILNDGLGTPVPRTFVTRKIDAAGIAKWQRIDGGIPVGFSTLTAQLREPLRGSRTPSYRATYRIIVPKIATINTVATKVHECISETVFILPEASDADERSNIMAFTVNALNHADLRKLVRDLESIT